MPPHLLSEEAIRHLALKLFNPAEVSDDLYFAYRPKNIAHHEFSKILRDNVTYTDYLEMLAGLQPEEKCSIVKRFLSDPSLLTPVARWQEFLDTLLPKECRAMVNHMDLRAHGISGNTFKRIMAVKKRTPPSLRIECLRPPPAAPVVHQLATPETSHSSSSSESPEAPDVHMTDSSDIELDEEDGLAGEQDSTYFSNNADSASVATHPNGLGEPHNPVAPSPDPSTLQSLRAGGRQSFEASITTAVNSTSAYGGTTNEDSLGRVVPQYYLTETIGGAVHEVVPLEADMHVGDMDRELASDDGALVSDEQHLQGQEVPPGNIDSDELTDDDISESSVLSSSLSESSDSEIERQGLRNGPGPPTRTASALTDGTLHVSMTRAFPTDAVSPSTVQTFHSAPEQLLSKESTPTSSPPQSHTSLLGVRRPSKDFTSQHADPTEREDIKLMTNRDNAFSSGSSDESSPGEANENEQTAKIATIDPKLEDMPEHSPNQSCDRSITRSQSPRIAIERLPKSVLAQFHAGHAESSRVDDGQAVNQRRRSDSDRASTRQAASSSPLDELSKSPTPVRWDPDGTGGGDDHDSGEKPPKKRKRTGAKSDHFESPAKKQRVPAGTSAVKFPPTTAPRFGLVQENLWEEPFKLLVAVVFLNKTAGRSAMPIYRQLMEKYPTPKLLADADKDELLEMIRTLGLQRQRRDKLIKLARTWISDPPQKGRRHRTLHYPERNDGKGLKPEEVVETDNQDCAGALEIGHMPGCGPYANDSWRIFCRDFLRGVANGYNGEGAAFGFEPEWKRVLPLDKELRAFLRWMWLKEGYIWDPLTGKKRVADEATLEKAKRDVTEWDVPDENVQHEEEGDLSLETNDEVSPDNQQSEGVGQSQSPSVKREPADSEGDYKMGEANLDQAQTVHTDHAAQIFNSQNTVDPDVGTQVPPGWESSQTAATIRAREDAASFTPFIDITKSADISHPSIGRVTQHPLWDLFHDPKPMSALATPAYDMPGTGTRDFGRLDGACEQPRLSCESHAEPQKHYTTPFGSKPTQDMYASITTNDLARYGLTPKQYISPFKRYNAAHDTPLSGTNSKPYVSTFDPLTAAYDKRHPDSGFMSEAPAMANDQGPHNVSACMAGGNATSYPEFIQPDLPIAEVDGFPGHDRLASSSRLLHTPPLPTFLTSPLPPTAPRVPRAQTEEIFDAFTYGDYPPPTFPTTASNSKLGFHNSVQANPPPPSPPWHHAPPPNTMPLATDTQDPAYPPNPPFYPTNLPQSHLDASIQSQLTAQVASIASLEVSIEDLKRRHNVSASPSQETMALEAGELRMIALQLKVEARRALMLQAMGEVKRDEERGRERKTARGGGGWWWPFVAGQASPGESTGVSPGESGVGSSPFLSE
ncbi:putative HhH-GPD superfamily base excision DNA repair protein-1 [Elsinoe australis]|uniref:Putative HhH-GPD superfamily base excision DNA repair protein-1 n=1 Tax=Elsinoe australis TaxID=40998 RepID=A0A4U7AW31_9PEZI|nr:putative HhH-GPD superfamily base excision DNA repair protein-1 [Elsinoe australis]